MDKRVASADAALLCCRGDAADRGDVLCLFPGAAVVDFVFHRVWGCDSLAEDDGSACDPGIAAGGIAAGAAAGWGSAEPAAGGILDQQERGAAQTLF